MTEIVTISAATAAYATEPLKPGNRVSGAGLTPDTTHAQVLEARTADNRRHQEMMNIVGPPAIAVFFLTAGERGRRLQQATMREVAEAYFADRDEETDAVSADANDKSRHEFDRRRPVLALPAPERYP